MSGRIYPAEPVYHQPMQESGDPNSQPPILEEQPKYGACTRGLWDLFHPLSEWGPRLANALRLADGADKVRERTVAIGEPRPWATPADLAVTSTGSR